MSRPVSTKPTTTPAARAAKGSRQRILLDSSCWLEWLADTPRARLFEKVLDHPQDLIVPVVVVYEVTKKLRREAGDDVAWQALSLLQQGQTVEVDLTLAVEATGTGLPLADSLIYATAQRHGAELWTQDVHFEGLPGVRFFQKD